MGGWGAGDRVHLPDSVRPQDRAGKAAPAHRHPRGRMAGSLAGALVCGRLRDRLLAAGPAHGPRETDPGRRDDEGSGARKARASASYPHRRGLLPLCAQVAAPRRGRPLARARRDAAHHRLGHHGFGQDRPDIGPGRADKREGGALHPLRQDGKLHAGLLRPRARRAHESPGRPGAAVVTLPGSQDTQGLRYHGGRPYPPAEGHGGPLLGHGRAAAVRERRGRFMEARRDGEPCTRRAPAQDRTHVPGGGHGGHGGAVHRGPRKPQDRALGARHADRSPGRARVPARLR